jgi:DNA-binding CsgD family transcriptional regulator
VLNVYGHGRTNKFEDDNLRRVQAVKTSCAKKSCGVLNLWRLLMSSSSAQIMSQKTKSLIDKLLLGNFSLAEIAKITGISEQGLETYLNSKYDFSFS